MKVLHLIATGNIGGIQTLLKDYGAYSQIDNIFTFMWSGGPNEEEMRSRGITTVCFEADKVGFLRAARELLRYFEEEKPGAVIVHSSPLLRLIGAYMKWRDKKIKLFFYCHSDVQDQLGRYRFPKRQICDAINKICIVKSDKVIAISSYVGKTVQKIYRVPENKVLVVYNSVDVKKFDVPLHEPEQTIKLVFVGRLIKVKGVQIALQALKRLPGNLSWQFHIVGEGTYLKELRQLTCELGLEEQVVFWGNRKDVPQVLSEMDIFLHVCTWEEGFGISIIEAMAAGKICVCSSSGAIPEIITNGEDGYLVEKENIAALAQLLTEIMTNQSAWKAIQLKAKRTAAKYRVERFAHKLDGLVFGQVMEECFNEGWNPDVS